MKKPGKYALHVDEDYLGECSLTLQLMLKEHIKTPTTIEHLNTIINLLEVIRDGPDDDYYDADMLLGVVADEIKKGGQFPLGDALPKEELRDLCCRILVSCDGNLKEHGEAISWMDKSVEGSLDHCTRLVEMRMITLTKYEGSLKAPENVSHRDGLPLVFRATDSLILTACSKLNITRTGIPV